MFSYCSILKLSLGMKIFYRRLHHVPVLKEEVSHYLNPACCSIILDMTFGAGGHTKNLLDSSSNLKVICLDRDPVSYKHAKELSESYPNRVVPCIGRFSEAHNILKKLGMSFNSIDGILFDFGCSSMQMDSNERGFAISRDAKMDMRMDGLRFPNDPSAAQVLEYADEDDLAKIFKIYGEEKLAKKIARAVIEARYTFRSVSTTFEFAVLVADVCENKYKIDKLQRPAHVATKIFQALRIFVNNELNEINHGLSIAHKYLKIGGKLVTISFHSLEDRLVKYHLTGMNIMDNSELPLKYKSRISVNSEEKMNQVIDKNWMMLNKHVITPGRKEVEINPRSRSAKLRAAVKLK